jgi:hypothetical protein
MEECVVAIVAVQYPSLYRATIKNELDEILAKHDPFTIMKKKKGKKAWTKIIDALIKNTKATAKSTKNDDVSPKKKRFRPRRGGVATRQVPQAASQEDTNGRGGFKPRGGYGYGYGRGGR